MKPLSPHPYFRWGLVLLWIAGPVASPRAGVEVGLGKAAAKRAGTSSGGLIVSSGLTLNGPSGGGMGLASSPFTVGSKRPLTGAVVVTPSDGGDGGTFSPATLTLTPESRTAVFTYTSYNSGDKTISISNDAGLPNPPGIPYRISSAVSGDVVAYLTHDGDAVGNVTNTSAPNRLCWNTVLSLLWKRGAWGDWLDANHNPFGSSTAGAVPYASFAVPAPGVYSADVTSLVQRWMSNGQNKGFYLRMRNNAFNVRFAGRTDPDPSLRPKLILSTSGGPVTLTPRANATWNISTYQSVSSALLWELASGQPAIVQFDLSSISGSVTGATLQVVDTFHAVGSTMTNGIVDVFEADPPFFVVPDTVTDPVVGLAHGLSRFQDIATQPGVLFSDDFASPGPFDSGWSRPSNIERALNPDTDTTYARGDFVAGSNGSASIKILAMRGAGGHGGQGMTAIYDELYSQYHVYLDSDYGSDIDGIKIPAMGTQFGWWNIASGGYWSSVTGNGGTPGTGLKVYNSGQSRWEYQGHSVRILTSMKAADASAYGNLYALFLYPYNLDQGGPFPVSPVFPYVVIQKGKWYAFDLYMKLNSMSGTPDANGNYPIANADGEYTVWVNGYPSFHKGGYRWRYHPEFGVEGFWLDFYHGGVPPAPYTMHYRVDRVTVATSYIGPQ